LGEVPYCASHIETCEPSELSPVAELVVLAWLTSGAGWPRTIWSKKWLMRYICVDGSPLVRFTLQSNVVVTSKADSQTLGNSVKVVSKSSVICRAFSPSMIYGTDWKLAPASMKVTRRVPALMSADRVGQSPLPRLDVGG
jgi:hypothetical protein